MTAYCVWIVHSRHVLAFDTTNDNDVYTTLLVSLSLSSYGTSSLIAISLLRRLCTPLPELDSSKVWYPRPQESMSLVRIKVIKKVRLRDSPSSISSSPLNSPNTTRRWPSQASVITIHKQAFLPCLRRDCLSQHPSLPHIRTQHPTWLGTPHRPEQFAVRTPITRLVSEPKLSDVTGGKTVRTQLLRKPSIRLHDRSHVRSLHTPMIRTLRGGLRRRARMMCTCDAE